MRKRVCEPFLPRGDQKSLQTRVTRCHPISGGNAKHSFKLKPMPVADHGAIPASEFVVRLKERGIAWFATATTLAEAQTALASGADAIIVQGSEAGGHRGSFDPSSCRTAISRALLFVAASGRPHRSANYRRRRNRRRTGRRRGPDPGGECRDGGYGVLTLSRSKHTLCVGRGA